MIRILTQEQTFTFEMKIQIFHILSRSSPESSEIVFGYKAQFII
jgi:hypothetical protein